MSFRIKQIEAEISVARKQNPCSEAIRAGIIQSKLDRGITYKKENG